MRPWRPLVTRLQRPTPSPASVCHRLARRLPMAAAWCRRSAQMVAMWRSIPARRISWLVMSTPNVMSSSTIGRRVSPPGSALPLLVARATTTASRRPSALTVGTSPSSPVPRIWSPATPTVLPTSSSAIGSRRRHTRVNVGPAGIQADADTWPDGDVFWHTRGGLSNTQIAMSGDGRHVAFVSRATTLAPAPAGTVPTDVCVRDRQLDLTSCIRTPLSAGNEPSVVRPSVAISSDGRIVAIATSGRHVASDTNQRRDVYVHDRTTAETTRVSVSSAGQQGDGASGWPSLSADGRVVAFASDARNLIADETNGPRFVYSPRSPIGDHDSDLGIPGASTHAQRRWPICLLQRSTVVSTCSTHKRVSLTA